MLEDFLAAQVSRYFRHEQDLYTRELLLSQPVVRKRRPQGVSAGALPHRTWEAQRYGQMTEWQAYLDENPTTQLHLPSATL
jgi:hypothetical protein